MLRLLLARRKLVSLFTIMKHIETIRFEEQKDVMKLYHSSQSFTVILWHLIFNTVNEKKFLVTHIRKTLTFLFKLYFVFSQTCEESSKGL